MLPSLQVVGEPRVALRCANGLGREWAWAHLQRMTTRPFSPSCNLTFEAESSIVSSGFLKVGLQFQKLPYHLIVLKTTWHKKKFRKQMGTQTKH